MKKIIIGLILILSLVLVGCSTETQEVVCNKPYIKVGTKCCLDVNGNNICDKDEEEKSTKETISDQKENAEKIAKLFLVHWERKEYGKMYDLTIGSLTRLKSKDAFSWLMGQDDPVTALRYEGIVMKDSDTAYVQYTIVASVFEIKAPSVGLEYINGAWKVDAFANLFSSICGDNKCQTTEAFEKASEGRYCPLDCFGEHFRMYLNDYKPIFFMGKVYDLELLEIDGYNTLIEIQKIKVDLGHKEEFNILDNIFIEQSTIRFPTEDNKKQSVIFTIFNKDIK